VHPSEAIRGRKSSLLGGRTIVFGISGSIAAVEVPKVARELLRHGARLEAVLSEDAAGIITPEAIRFATGNPPVTRLTGDVEHVRWFGPGPSQADLFLICPATANTLSKVAHGIDDTPVATCASLALGAGVPVAVAPAMHGGMSRNPFVAESLDRLRRAGVHVISPVEEEGESKLASPETIAAEVIHILARGPWRGRRVLVVGGSTSEPLDEVRSLTNEGSGQLAVDLAVQAYFRGAEVETWMGELKVPWPPFLRVERFRTVEELRERVRSAGASLARFDAIWVPAALSDFRPRPYEGKIPSDQPRVSLELERVDKVLPEIRARAPAGQTLLIAFKLEARGDRLLEKAHASLCASGADAVVANDRRGMGGPRTEVVLVRPGQRPHHYQGTKDVVAGRLLDEVAVDLPARPPSPSGKG
jgi:phosphopantothenoylcysteine decarboxylase/phosphopantothenate--cysteine ligase